MGIAAKERKEKGKRTKLHSDTFHSEGKSSGFSNALILRSLRSFAAAHSRF